MTNLTLQQRKQISDGAPDKTATHWNGQFYLRIINNDWQFYWSGWCQPCEPVADIISLSDNDEIIALHERVAKLEQQVPKWISVEDRLPVKDYQNVLVFCDGGNIQATKFHSDRAVFKWEKAACYSRKAFGKYSGHFSLCHELGYKITHWMPLPTPPEEVE